MNKNRLHLILFILIVAIVVAFIAAIMIRENSKIKVVAHYISQLEADIEEALRKEEGLDPHYLAFRRKADTLLIAIEGSAPPAMATRHYSEPLIRYFATVHIPEEFGILEVILMDDRTKEEEPRTKVVLRDYRLI